MKPGRKITLIYSGITIGLVLMAGLVFYLLSSRYTRRLYYHYLEEKAYVVAMERFEKDELDSVRYQNVVWRRQHAIPTSGEWFINMADPMRADSLLGEYLTHSQIAALRRDEVVNFRRDDEVGTALIYYDNEGTFAVLLLSRNPYGEAVAHTIGWSLLALVLLSSLVLWLISRLYAARMVNRIDQRYQAERLFVDNASHELNNPLTAIQGECEVALLRDRSPEEYRQTLRTVTAETKRIIAIMQQLMHLSHEVPLSPKNLPIPPSKEGTLATSVFLNGEIYVTLSAFLQAYVDERTQLEVVEDFCVGISEDVLRMSLGNIIGNARKYSGNQPVHVRVAAPVVEVTDKGIGIPAADLPHIFSPFHRARNARSVPGHGIGLSLAKRLLERHGAQVSVKSTGSTGTTFVVSFQ